MLDRYTTGPRKPSIYKVDNALGADQRVLFAYYEALDHLGDTSLADAAGHVFGECWWDLRPRVRSGSLNPHFCIRFDRWWLFD